MTVIDQMLAVLESLKAMPPTRARALAITKLEEAAFWTSAAMAHVDSPIDWVAKKPSPKSSTS